MIFEHEKQDSFKCEPSQIIFSVNWCQLDYRSGFCTDLVSKLPVCFKPNTNGVRTLYTPFALSIGDSVVLKQSVLGHHIKEEQGPFLKNSLKWLHTQKEYAKRN